MNRYFVASQDNWWLILIISGICKKSKGEEYVNEQRKEYEIHASLVSDIIALPIQKQDLSNLYIYLICT